MNFDKVNRYFQDGEIPEVQKQEDEYLITTFENLKMNKTELSLQSVVEDITVNSDLNKMERASYSNNLRTIWDTYHNKSIQEGTKFSLCPVWTTTIKYSYSKEIYYTIE